MKRREFLSSIGSLVVCSTAFPLQWARAASGKKQRVLYFTRSAGFEHSVVRRKGDQLAFSERVLTEMGKRAGFEVVCTKDGRVFDSDLDQYDTIAFYTSGDLTKPNRNRTPPMTPRGKQRLLDWVAAGGGFVGFHSATDSFHSRGGKVDPYIAMIGGEFVIHGAQQAAGVKLVDPAFPNLQGIPSEMRLKEEWYTQKNLAPDLHVILLQETKDMRGKMYQRPPYPQTWARRHGKGRVFYTSFGHREDIWTNPKVQQVMLAGFAWTMGNVEADVTPNIAKVAPGANQLPR